MKIYLVLALLVATPALAQIGPSGGYGAGPGYGGSGGGYGGATGVPGHGASAGGQSKDDADAGEKPEKPAEPPPAIPGAQPDSDAAVVPAERSSAEMSPNEALFDAIDRGDAAAAKDALSRGAQLDAKNVLGQDPIDAAIDLSRNDITFLLLSMRGAAPAAHAAAPIVAADAGAQKKGKKIIVKASVSRAPPPPDRGTPNPAVGFTGF